jgi:hypothetical protein
MKVWLLPPCFKCREVRGSFLRYLAGGSRWIAPGRIGYMSTERREGLWPVRSLVNIGATGFEIPDPCASRRETSSQGQTARPEVNSGSVGHKSLQLDCRSLELVRLRVFRFRHGSPPSTGSHIDQPDSRALLRLSHSPTPSPSGIARLHRTLPQAPTAQSWRPERYDGKGNLYLQHAA